MRNLLVICWSLATISCDPPPTPCQDSVSVVKASWAHNSTAQCPHRDHIMKTEKLGFTSGGAVQITCTCRVK